MQKRQLPYISQSSLGLGVKQKELVLLTTLYLFNVLASWRPLDTFFLGGGGGTLGAGASISPLGLPDPRKMMHMRPQNLNDPESDQAPLCRRVKLGEERCLTTQRTPAYKITGNTALKKKKRNEQT